MRSDVAISLLLGCVALAAVGLSANSSTSSSPTGAPQQDLRQEDHATLLPLCQADVLTLALVAIVSFVAAGAGIGGGGVLLPIFVLLARFPMHNAVALSE